MTKLEGFYESVPKWIANGELHPPKEHIYKGLDNGEAFLDLMTGQSTSSMNVFLDRARSQRFLFCDRRKLWQGRHLVRVGLNTESIRDSPCRTESAPSKRYHERCTSFSRFAF
jgi:hypothetical protein